MPRPNNRTQVLQLIAQLGPAATVARLARELNVRIQTMSEQVRALQHSGLIERAGRQQPITLTPAGREHARLRPGGFPVLGEIAAGEPIYAEQQVETYVEDLRDYLGLVNGDYFLRVRGDSMTGDGIHDGNLVAVRPADEVLDGEIAVVLVPGESTATLKRLYRQGERVTLRSSNPAYADMTFHASEVRVQGRYLHHVGRAPRRSGERRGEGGAHG